MSYNYAFGLGTSCIVPLINTAQLKVLIPYDGQVLFSSCQLCAVVLVSCEVDECDHVMFGAIQVLRNADGGGGCLIFWKKALRRCNVQCY